MTMTVPAAAPQRVEQTERTERILRTRPDEFLTFRLGPGEYGVDILRVQEIRSYSAPTRLADAPPHVEGVINLRGVIVPIVDMRLKSGLAVVHTDGTTAIIVLSLAQRVVGIVVDAVCDVVSVTQEQIKPVPDLGGDIRTEHLLGIGTLDERMLVLLDIERMLGDIA